MMDGNDFEQLDKLEAEGEVDVRTWLEELTRTFLRLAPERRAYKVIKTFMSIDDPNERQYRLFLSWFTDEHNAEAKDKAFERVISEMGAGSLE